MPVGFEQIIPMLAERFGIAPSHVVFAIMVAVAIANLVGRVIPDDATGILGIIRKVCKFIGLYVPNTITPGVTTNDVAKAALSQTAEELPREVVQAFPGFKRANEEMNGDS